MRQLSTVMCVLAVVAVCGSSVYGADLSWAGVVDGKWSTTGNWATTPGGTTYGPSPAAGDTVFVSTVWGAFPTLVVDAPAVGGALNLAYAGGNSSMDIQSSLTAANLYGGIFGAGTATINLNSASGSIVTTGDTFIGYYQANSILNMSAGTMTNDHFYIGYTAGAHGAATVTGGTITTNWLGMDAAGGFGTLTLGGTGKVVIKNTYGTTSDWMGIFSAWSGTKILNAQANVVGNTVEITAIPEPATLVLLALGGIAALKRRRA